jgi:recombination associated protein RdgC
MLELSMADKLRRTQFLGREFLTWLLWRSVRDEGVFKLADGTIVELFFERALTLDGDNPAREMATLKVDDPAQSEEVMLSLRLGKRVSRARLLVLTGGREFTFVVDGATLGLRTLRLPDAMGADPAEIQVERAGLCREIEDVVHELFAQFVRMRIDPAAWAPQAQGVRDWLNPPTAAREESPNPPPRRARPVQAPPKRVRA